MLLNPPEGSGRLATGSSEPLGEGVHPRPGRRWADLVCLAASDPSNGVVHLHGNGLSAHPRLCRSAGRSAALAVVYTWPDERVNVGTHGDGPL